MVRVYKSGVAPLSYIWAGKCQPPLKSAWKPLTIGGFHAVSETRRLFGERTVDMSGLTNVLIVVVAWWLLFLLP